MADKSSHDGIWGRLLRLFRPPWTAREARETAEMRRRYEFIVNTSDDFMSIISRGFRYEAVNEAYCRATGNKREDVIGRTVDELWGEETFRNTIKNHLEACFTGRVVQYEEWFQFGGRSRRCFHVSYYPYRDEEGVVTHAVVISHDITERVRAEEERTLLVSAVDQAAESILITDAEGTIQYVNPFTERVTGYTRAELIGQNPRLLKSGRQDGKFYEHFWRTIEGGDVWRGHFVNKTKEGNFFEEEAVVFPVRDASGEVVNYVAVKRDVSEQMALEDQLRQAQKMEAIGQLAGGVAHDFNNLLMIIMNGALFVKDALPPTSTGQGDLADVINAGKRASALTRQLLAFSRRQTLVPQVTDLNGVVVGVEKMLTRLIGENIVLTTKIDETPCMAEVDVGQVEQVIVNMVVNARDAMPDGGRITVETMHATRSQEDVKRFLQVAEPANAGRYVGFAVSDTGEGMDKETMSHIFEPFFTTKELGRGTGLGLSTVYGIVKQHGGHVSVYSEQGLGTTFKVYLPELTEEAGAEEVEEGQAEQTAPRGHETIFLVEDEPAVRRMGVRMLRDLGYVVIEAGNGEEALQVAESYVGNIHLLLTDIVMPGMTGKQLADQITVMRPGVKVIYASGYPEAHLQRHGVLDSRCILLPKPFVMAQMAHKLREVLDADDE